MYTKLYLENFRAYEQISIDLNKINLFFGPNNSGKSSLISALTLFSQTVQAVRFDADIMMIGKFEDFGTYYDMVNENDESKNITIRVESELEIPYRVYTEKSKSGRRLYKIVEKLIQGCVQVEIGYNKNQHEIQLVSTEISIPEDQVKIKMRRNRLGRYVVDSFKGLPELSEDELSQIVDVRNLLPIFYATKLTSRHQAYEKIRKISQFVSEFRGHIRKTEFISAFRSNPKRIYEFTGESPFNVGRHGERALEIMFKDEKRKGKSKKGLLKLTSDWMKKAELASSVYTESMTDRYFELRVENYHTGEAENLADVGFGFGQILPVLIAGLNMNEGLFIVQEPEIHLHPKAQAELGTFFRSLYERGTQLVIETHSEYLMLRLQSHIAKGEIKAKDVNVYYVDPKDKRKKRKKVTKLEIDTDGYFINKWPRGFFPERLNEAKRLAGLKIQKE